MTTLRIFAFDSVEARNKLDFQHAIELKPVSSVREFTTRTSDHSNKVYRYLDYFDENMQTVGEYDDAYQRLGGTVSYDVLGEPEYHDPSAPV